MGQFRFFTAGESHGKGLVAIVEGMVADLPLEAEYIDKELKRRQQGYGRGLRMKIEQDEVQIISGIRYGFTIGSPIALYIPNRDWQNWQEKLSVAPLEKEAEPVTYPRPGHADLAGVTKYGLKDIRPIIERASARETAARVAAGAVAKRFLEELGIAIHSHTTAIGHVSCEPFPSSVIAVSRSPEPKLRAEGVAISEGEAKQSHLAQDKPCSERSESIREATSITWQQVEASPVRCADAKLEKEMIAAIDEAKANGDTLGGIFEVIASGVPIGLGSHVSWERRLDGRIAQAIMSINAVKGVEIGSGFALAELKGSQAHDVIEPNPPAVIAVSQSTEPFAPCHSERVSRSPEQSEGEESHGAQDRLREGEESRLAQGKPCSERSESIREEEATKQPPLPWRHATNRAGGIEGGISNGDDIVVKAAVKPIATLANPLPSIDLRSGEAVKAHYERSDICVVPAAGVIAEAMLAIILADACLEKFGGDNLKETLANYHNYLNNTSRLCL